jgi:hypothetical protein
MSVVANRQLCILPITETPSLPRTSPNCADLGTTTSKSSPHEDHRLCRWLS